MSDTTNIEWTDCTWNPTTGCTKVSPGCKNCYAERTALRLQRMGSQKYKDGFEVRLHPATLGDPEKWKKPRMIFVNSMSDLFHYAVREDFVESVFDVMGDTPRHTYQILTKRASRLCDMGARLTWHGNVAMGVSIENDEMIWRLDMLKQTQAATKFISLEPLLGPMPEMNLDGIDWVIAGGESGPDCRPMAANWVRGIRDQCIETDTPFFFKQWGGTGRDKGGCELDGRTWKEFPWEEKNPLNSHTNDMLTQKGT